LDICNETKAADIKHRNQNKFQCRLHQSPRVRKEKTKIRKKFVKTPVMGNNHIFLLSQ
jgi:hypothetical protein